MSKFQSIQLPREEQPQNKLLHFGAEYLSNQDLLLVVIGGNNDDVAKNILSEFENMRNLSQSTIEELTNIKGIGYGKGAMLLAVFELSKRISEYKAPEPYTIRSPEDGADYVMEEMRYLKQEHLVALFLNTKNQVIHKLTIFIGSLNSSIVHPRELFREAVKRSSASLIIIHNHPSGDPTPSQEDIHVTKRVADSGKMIGIELLDSIIIGDRKFTSLKEKGYV